MRPARLTVIAAASVAAALAAVTGCSQKSDAGGDGVVRVAASDSACEVSKTEFPSGKVQIDVENKGSKVTEVYVLFPDARIVTERENIGPGTKASITAEIKAGEYEIVCKPGMKGDGIKQKVKATGKGGEEKRSPEADAAVAEYRAYLVVQTNLSPASMFTGAVKAGNIEMAKKLYAPSRIGWESTEPVAESFGDIDPKVDVREDGLEPGQEWTGWHRLEKSLWAENKIDDNDKKLADTLMADLTDWQKRVGTAEITPSSIANGAKELLDEVATGKVTGEEERYSHTDLVDFKANVDGAQKAFEVLKPIVSKTDPELTKTLDTRFAAMHALLDKYYADKATLTFVSYDTVGEAERKELSDAVSALGEPLSKLAAAVTK
ncbi:iron uptake system protein EfeO [Streptomyces sp. LARHCF249]